MGHVDQHDGCNTIITKYMPAFRNNMQHFTVLIKVDVIDSIANVRAHFQEQKTQKMALTKLVSVPPASPMSEFYRSLMTLRGSLFWQLVALSSRLQGIVERPSNATITMPLHNRKPLNNMKGS